jgi:hypothetical protein
MASKIDFPYNIEFINLPKLMTLLFFDKSRYNK